MAAVQIPQTPALPAAGKWAIDTTHTEAAFTARHLMVTKVRGRFAVSAGVVTIAEDPLESSVEATLDVASVHSGEPGRDEHLLSADFFDVEHYPTITFASTAVRPLHDNSWELVGDLTVRDTTKPVTLQVDFDGGGASPMGDERIGFSAATDINREDFGLTWNVTLETGGLLVGKAVRIELAVQAIAAAKAAVA